MPPTLFSYVVRDDAGSAPNPYWGVCTLVNCKPRIRRAAQVGDWVVGTGSARSPIGNIKEQVVYAMRVTDKMTLREYDAWAEEYRPEKVPDPRNRDPRRKVGDAIYDFSGDAPLKRPGPHNESNRKTDLDGKYALLSEYFFYFGNQPVALPERLRGLVKQGTGHRAPENDPYVEPFVDWLTGLGYQPNEPQGDPQLMQPRSVRVELVRKPQRH
jgi:hypothetical protein